VVGLKVNHEASSVALQDRVPVPVLEILKVVVPDELLTFREVGETVRTGNMLVKLTSFP
jgi:hypothetical protein